MSGASDLYSRIERARGVTCKRDVPASSFTSFEVGGPVAIVALAEDIEGLRNILRLISDAGASWFVVGAGTNVVFGERGFGGVVVKLGSSFSEVTREGVGIRAGASALLSDAVSFCAEQSLAGLERLAGIPGSMGGAVAGNAGAFGVTIGEKVKRLSGVEIGGAVREMKAGEVDFDYRRADFGAAIVLTEVVLSLEEGRRDLVLAETEKILRKRRKKQPYEFPCAGSVFKNPAGMKAAKLIEDAGLKGRKIGGAEVSEKHANFIINRGGASSSDVLSLIDVVRNEVRRQFSVSLELEIKVVQ